jgi:hypothetical protein
MKYTIDKHDRYIVIEPHVDVIDADNAAKLKEEFCCGIRLDNGISFWI